MSDTFTLDVAQATEIKHAVIRAGGTNADLKKLSSGDIFAQILPFLRGRAEIVIKSILELINPEIKVLAREKFVVKDHFKKENAGIYYLGDNFQAWFGGLTENAPAATLSSHKLTQSSVDEPIRAELGENYETFLAWLFEKIEQQAYGREGDLFVNGDANIWYVSDVNGVLRAVHAHWGAGGDGWIVGADVVSSPSAWCRGDRVFSRNSVLESSDTQA